MGSVQNNIVHLDLGTFVVFEVRVEIPVRGEISGEISGLTKKHVIKYVYVIFVPSEPQKHVIGP